MTSTQCSGHVVLLKIWVVKDCRSKTESSYVVELGEQNVGPQVFIVPTADALCNGFLSEGGVSRRNSENLGSEFLRLRR